MVAHTLNIFLIFPRSLENARHDMVHEGRHSPAHGLQTEDPAGQESAQVGSVRYVFVVFLIHFVLFWQHAHLMMHLYSNIDITSFKKYYLK